MFYITEPSPVENSSNKASVVELSSSDDDDDDCCIIDPDAPQPGMLYSRFIVTIITKTRSSGSDGITERKKISRPKLLKYSMVKYNS